jgi:hypothetical protein
MLREVTTDEIIFRNVVSAKEGVMKYHDGVWYKPADEIKKAAETTEKKALMTGTHLSPREIGYVTKPKYGKPYKRGKMIRDWHFKKSQMNKEEIEQLLTGEKMDVSMGYKTDNIKMAGTFNTMQYDGINANLEVDHFLWTHEGRCSEKDGCGLRRTDSTDEFRYDALPATFEQTDEALLEQVIFEYRGDEAKAASDCVSKKVKILAKEHPDWDRKKVIAAAYKYCKKGKEKETKGDSSMTTDNNEGSTPPANEDEVSQEDIKSLMSEFKEFKVTIDSLVKQISKEDKGETPPTTETTSQTPPPETKPETGGEEGNKEVISSINALKTEFKEDIQKIIDIVQKSTMKRSSSFPLKGQEENNE